MKPALAVSVCLLALALAAPTPAAAQTLPLRCELYLALDEDPGLRDFPVVITSARRGHVRAEIASLAWLEAQGTFSLKALDEKEKELRNFLASRSGVVSVSVERDGMLKLADVDAQVAADMEEYCPARVDVRVDPGGAMLFVDGEPKGEVPAVVEIASGERRLMITRLGYRPHLETIRLPPGEARALDVVLTRLGDVVVDTTPPGAVILVDGGYLAMSPAKAYVEAGSHTITVRKPGFETHRMEIDTELGQVYTVEAELVPVEGDGCYRWDVSGTVKQAFKSFKSLLVGQRLDLTMPLYRVRSSVMENELPTTHVVDGRSILFEARLGDDYVDHPSKLLWRELGGLSFGEVGTEVLESPIGSVTVTDVEKKKRSLVIELRHDRGEKNAVYLDFTGGIDTVDLGRVMDALCWVVAPAR